MSGSESRRKNRRDILRLMGGGAAFISFAGLSACSDEPSSAPAPKRSPSDASDSMPEPKPAAEPTKEAAQPPTETMNSATDVASDSPVDTTSGSNQLPRLTEDNPQASALGYRNDTKRVDGQRFANHSAEQACRNCALYSGLEGEAWGPCGIFPAHQVNAGGWCSAYNPKS